MQRTLNYTLDLLNLHETNPARYPYLLQSVAHGTPQARYDILFAFPGEKLALRSSGIYGTTDNRNQGFLDALDACWSREASHDSESTDLPFTGGWFLYLGYELAQEIEPVLKLPLPPENHTIAQACRIPAAIILDHEKSCTYLVAETGQDSLLDLMKADTEQAKDISPKMDAITIHVVNEEQPDIYLRGIEQVKHYIVEGDIFQANISRAWNITLAPDTRSTDIYRALRQHNPAPFAGIARLDNEIIISSSPERLIKVSGRDIQTRPIAGTRPRSSEQDADLAYSSELMSHPKESAEHVMLIDLERNDLGRVCEAGSVRVDEKMVLESYAHVHHIVSNIRGKLKEGITPGEIIHAVFPGGTITGCPKVRCMQIIAELEQNFRGAYTGSMGYLNLNGDMDLNILIRTMTYNDKQLVLRAGAGIVADSIPEKELEETRAKAKGMLLALGVNNL